METSLHYSLDSKQLSFKLREIITADLGVELKAHGLFNTVTSTFDYNATLKKKVSTGPAVKGLGNEPLVIAGGLKLNSVSKNDVFLTASAKKKLSLFDGPNTTLSVKAEIDFDPKQSKVAKRGKLVAQRRFINFINKQDLQLKAGVEVSFPNGRDPKAVPRFSVRENNWGAHYQSNKWLLTYDL